MKNQTLISIAIVFIAVFLSFGCQSKPEKGQVIGVLHNSDGTTYAENASVFAINENDITAGNVSNDLNFRTNGKGEFKLENIKEGSYRLYIFLQPKADNQTGISNVPSPVMGQIINKGKPVTFVMPTNEGIDLGDIEVTEILKFN